MADKAPDVENSILGVGMEHVLCAITDTDMMEQLELCQKRKKAYLSVVMR